MSSFNEFSLKTRGVKLHLFDLEIIVWTKFLHSENQQKHTHCWCYIQQMWFMNCLKFYYVVLWHATYEWSLFKKVKRNERNAGIIMILLNLSIFASMPRRKHDPSALSPLSTGIWRAGSWTYFYSNTWITLMNCKAIRTFWRQTDVVKYRCTSHRHFWFVVACLFLWLLAFLHCCLVLLLLFSSVPVLD